MENYIVATIKPWNKSAFSRHSPSLPGNWKLIHDVKSLTIETLTELDPRYIFFPHWSWVVPDNILNRWECVCFHMTDVPYGRGGSPLQNLIVRGYSETKLSALRMIAEVDAGPVYLKLPLSLEGRAQEIFERTADLVYAAIEHIVRVQPEPTPQFGESIMFKRRTPQQSELPANLTMSQLRDFIRMLDADTYPPAFIDHGPYRIEFHDAQSVDESIFAKVCIRLQNNDNESS